MLHALLQAAALAPVEEEYVDPIRRPRESPASSTTRVLPVQLKPGDCFSTESGEREVVGRPYTSAGGKMVHGRVQYIGQPATVALWVWGAHERVTVKRTTGEEDK